MQRNGPILLGMIYPEIKDFLLEKNAEERLSSGEIHHWDILSQKNWPLSAVKKKLL